MSSVTPKNLTLETFVRNECRILISIAFFWLENALYEVLLTLRGSLLALIQLSTPTSSLFTMALTLLMTLSDAKTFVMNKTHLIWASIHYMSLIYTRKSTGHNTEPSRTPNVMFDMEQMQFFIETNCFLLLKYKT